MSHPDSRIRTLVVNERISSRVAMTTVVIATSKVRPRVCGKGIVRYRWNIVANGEYNRYMMAVFRTFLRTRNARSPGKVLSLSRPPLIGGPYRNA